MDIAKAEDFCRSYGQAMKDGSGTALAGHYSFPYVSFTNGWISIFKDQAEADESVSSHVARFERRGLGVDIRLSDFRVEPVSEGSALCHLRWEIFPADDTPGWSWGNIYGLRVREDGGMAFEFNISDNEIGELLGRFPDFMTS